MLGMTSPSWIKYPIVATIALVAVRVLVNGIRAEKDFLTFKAPSGEPRVRVQVDAVRAGGADATGDLVTDRASGRSFAADPGRTLLDGIESAGLTQDFGCRMGMCGADPIAIVEGMENLSPPNDDELATLRRLGLEGRARMACVCNAAAGPVTIDLEIDPNELPEPPPPADQVDLGEETGIQRVVIIGNGTSGMAAADEIRRMSTSCKIDVVARENHLFYNRMAVGRLLYGRTGLEDLYLMAPDWYEKHDITMWLNTQATAIDREACQVTLGTGETLPYDRLVLAMGSSAFVPPAEGADLPGCFVLREAADVQAIRAHRQEHGVERAVVLGGGVLGIEAADALRRVNLKTTIVHRSDSLMNRELDERGAAILRHFLEELGVDVVTGASVAAIKGNSRVEAIELTNGETLPAGIFVSCAGVSAITDLAGAAGLTVGRGVVVDAQMKTSDDKIFAVGDVAELPGEVRGLWGVGTSQAAVAAAAMFGKEIAYKAPSTLVSLKMDGIDVKGFGSLETEKGGEEIMDAVESDTLHRRIVIDNGQIKGAVFVGPPGSGKHITQAVQKQADVTGIVDRLRKGDWDALIEV